MSTKIDIDTTKYFSDSICNKIDSMVSIGSGQWGKIYKFDIKKNRFSVKVQSTRHGGPIDLRNIELEIKILKHLSRFKERNNMHFFPFYYYDRNCNNNRIIIYENYELSLKDIIKVINVNLFKSIVFQIIFSVFLFHSTTRYEHRDIHVGNILVNKTSHDIKYRVYSEYKIPYYGFEITLWDYSNAVPIKKRNAGNTDLNMIKIMFHKFLKDEIFANFSSEVILEFATKNGLSEYYEAEMVSNGLRWSSVNNLEKRNEKIKISTLKSLIYKVIEEPELYNKFMKEHKTFHEKYPIKSSWLNWVKSLPSTINECLELVRLK